MSAKSALRMSVTAVLLAASGITFSATTPPTNIPVSATVSSSCTISTTSAIAFGSYDPIGTNATAPLNAIGTVSVTCSKGSKGLSIGISNGSHASGSQRQMQGATAADLLKYDLFQPPGSGACVFPGSLAWTNEGSGRLELADAPSKAVRAYSVCGTIPGGQDAATGNYADIVSATLNF